METKVTTQSWQYLAAVGGLAVGYFVAARFVVAIADFNQPVVPVWLPLGVALAVLLLCGRAIVPGLWIGQFWFMASVGMPWYAAAGTATGITLYALLAIDLLKRNHFHPSLTRLQDVAGLVLLASVLVAPLNALIGVASLSAVEVYPWSRFWNLVWGWWLGDAVAILLVTPVILTWVSPKPLRSRSRDRATFRSRLTEMGLWWILLLGFSWFVLAVRSQGEMSYPQEYLLFPLIIWAALRFGQRGTTLASLVISGVALWGLAQGGSPFLLNLVDTDRSIQFLQVFVIVVSLTGLFLAAAVSERQQAIVSLAQANDQLQNLAQTLDQQVHDRTQQLRQSETRTRRLMDSNIIGILFWDAAGNVIEANEAFYDLLGYTREEILVGQLNNLTVMPPNAVPDLTAGQAIDRSFEREFVHKDGRQIPVLVGTTYLGATESVEAMGVSYVIDLSESKRTQEALRESERRFRRLAESNIFGVAFGDFQGRIHYINDYLLSMLECDRAELLSGQRRWADMTPPEFLQLDLRAGMELQQRGVCTPYEKEFIRSDGQRIPVLIGAALLQEPYNMQQEIMAFCVDLTQLKQTEAALRQSQTEVAALNQDLQRRVGELQTLFEVIPIGISIAEDLACQRIKVNPAFAQILGVPAGDVAMPLPFRILQQNRELQLEEMPLQLAAIHGREIQGVELDVVRSDGSIVNLFGYASPLRDERGNTRGAVSAFLDITDRKRAEAEYAQLLLLEQAARTEAEAAQRRLTTVFETSPIGLGYLDRDRRVVAINEALAEIDGLSPAEHLGRSIEELFGETDPALVEIFQQLYETGQPFIAPNFALSVPGRSDRRPGYYNVYYLPDITPSGEVESVLVYILDVTDRVRLEQRELFLANASMLLSASLDYESTLAQLANLAVPQLADWCFVDVVEPDGAIRRIAIAHSDPQKVDFAWELDRRFPEDFDRPQGVPAVLRTGQAEIYTNLDEMLVAAAHNPEHLELMRQMKFCSAMILPLKIGAQTLGTMSLISAESARQYGSVDLALAEELARRAAHALDNARLYRQAQDLNRVKDEFLAILSHELRSPLNGILGWAQMLRRGKLNEATAARAFETIERNARAQVQLIDDLLDISRIIRGKLRLDVRSIELSHIIEAAIDAMRPAADAKEIQLQRLLDPAAGQVLGDPERLQQILWNLLSNAIKFTPKGGWVQVWLGRSEANVEILVTDSGKGIQSEFLPFVFERFRQADSSITRTYGGLGLGLAIVRHLVELHGGTVQVTSPGEGLGATFTVRLPLLAAHSEAGAERQAIEPLENDPIADLPQLEGLRVLVVDDEADARELMTAILQEAGAEALTVSNSAAVFPALEAFHPHVLISDIGMPGEDGYTLIRKVRSLDADRGGRIPAIALTAYAHETDRQRALAEGFQTHLSKPISAIDLVVVVASLAGRIGNS